jgi:hypothetical protein
MKVLLKCRILGALFVIGPLFFTISSMLVTTPAGAQVPAAVWSFDEAQGGVVTDCFGGNDGIVVGDAQWTLMMGWSGSSMILDGSSWVETPFAPIVKPEDSFVLEFALMDKAPASNEMEYVLGLERTNAQEISFGIEPVGRYGIFRFRDDSHIYTDVYTAEPILENRWYHIRIERNGPAHVIRMFVNGELVAQVEDPTQTTINGTGAQSFFLGADNNSTFGARGPFSGQIDEVKFYWTELPTDVSTSTLREGNGRDLLVVGRGSSRGEATLTLKLAAAGPVQLEIFDVAGRRLRTLSSSGDGKGLVTWTWDGRDETGRRLSSGVYFYRVLGPGARLRGRLVLLH